MNGQLMATNGALMVCFFSDGEVMVNQWKLMVNRPWLISDGQMVVNN